jgi:hypothetical protein
MSRTKKHYRKNKAILKRNFYLKQEDIKNYALAVAQDDDLKNKAKDFRDLISAMKDINAPSRSRTYEDLLPKKTSLDYFQQAAELHEQSANDQQELPQQVSKKKRSMAASLLRFVVNPYTDLVFSLATASIILALAANPVGVTLASVGLAYTAAKFIAKAPIFKKFAATRSMQKMLDSPVGRLFRSKLVKIPIVIVQKSLNFAHNPIGNSIAIALRFSGVGIDCYKHHTAAKFATQNKLLEEIKTDRIKVAKYGDRLNQLMPELNLVSPPERKNVRLKNTKFNTPKVFAQGMMDVVFSNPLAEVIEHVHELIEPEISDDGTLARVADAMALETDAALSGRRMGKWGKIEHSKIKRNELINELGIDYQGTNSLVDQAKHSRAVYEGLKSRKTRAAAAQYMTSAPSQKVQTRAALKNTFDAQTNEKAGKLVADLSAMSAKNTLKHAVARQHHKIKGSIIRSI